MLAGRSRTPPRVGAKFVTNVGTWEFRCPTLISVAMRYEEGKALPRPERDAACQWCYDNIGGGASDWRIAKYQGENGEDLGVFFFHTQAHYDAFFERYGIKPLPASKTLARKVRAPRAPRAPRKVARDGY
jgi:hypothetical protein